MFFAVSKSRDSLCAQSRFRDKKEKARTDCLLEFGVAGAARFSFFENYDTITTIKS